MPTELAQKLEGVRDFQKLLETVVKEFGETYSADVSSIVLSNPLDRNMTSICEYKLYPEANAVDMPVQMSFALPLGSSGFGTVTLARRSEFHENEINWIRISVAELSDVVRYVQINDVVQRDTFRSTFMSEIQNVMNYSLGLGDALFMVVNIIGKVLKVSRALFVCVDDEKAGWKAFEFWQREKLPSCQEYGWPTTDSPIIARSLLASSPIVEFEANGNSRLTPVQEELQLLNVRSLLGVPLKSEAGTHGCIILQHCEVRHEWTRGEIDMVQNVADTVAEALAKLPEEKRGAEPIMRLHQREVIDRSGDGGENILAVRSALRGALGQQAIPSASKTGAPKPAKPEKPAVTAPKEKPKPTPSTSAPAVTTAFPTPPATQPAATSQPSAGAPGQDVSALADSLMQQAQASGDAATADEVSSTLASLLQGMGVQTPPKPMPSQSPPTATPPAETPAAEGGGAWGDLDSIPTPGGGQAAPTPPAPPTEAPAAEGGGKWGDLDSIGTPSTADGGNGAAAGGAWGNLDSIPTPASGPARGGLGGAMLGKRTSKEGNASPLMASLHKDKSRFKQEVEFVDGGAIQIDEAQAQAKLQQVLASSNPTSDYIFGTRGLDPRIAGRIDGWISQIEAKDKYETPHAMQVAEYSVAIGKVFGMSDEELDLLRLAAILHDVGKLGLAANVLQKQEEELSDTELLLIMKHPIDGATLVEGFPELAMFAPIILAHHEEFDGNGYPAGLAGDDIPPAARIIHVASAYHSMVSPTKRRGGISEQEAQQALKAGSGKQYDPQVVDALIQCVQQGMVAAAR